MTARRGFTVVHMALALAVLGIVASLVFAVHSWWESHNAAMMEAGRAEIRAEVAARDEGQRKRVEAERARLAKSKADTEAAAAAAIKENEDAWRAKLFAAKSDLDRFIADVNTGRVVWRDAEVGRSASGGSAAVLPASTADLGACAGLIGGGTIPAEALPLFLLSCSEFARADALRVKLSAARGELAICTGEGLLPPPRQ